ncbi:hypothetical protein [Micromonospora siamensis]|uniref:Uncharacterized protein n=1 Tax=Micromonospora siamensis TaxID=299152 RepID=A0A1C5JWS9_9ACTN|nr:hypothetical protein [Micromonospora siamensis]SCG75025.1 hypothetical protein GA0074704_5114 [Micromonospora siamensis]
MLRLLSGIGDRLLMAFVPKVTVQATCTTWKRLCYCKPDCTSVSQWCDRGCDSTGTYCGPCNVNKANGCIAPCG